MHYGSALTERERPTALGCSLAVDAAPVLPATAQAVGVGAAPVVPASGSAARLDALPEDGFSASCEDHARARAVPKSNHGVPAAEGRLELQDVPTSLATGKLSSHEFTVVWEFLIRTARAVCRSGARMGPDGWAACDQAEDLAAEALLRLLSSETIPTALSPGETAAYLRTTVRNLAASWSRGRNGDPGEEGRSDPSFAEALGHALPGSAEELACCRELVDSALRCLEQSGRTGPRLDLVARLQFMEGWTDAEIDALPAYRYLLAKRSADETDLRQNVRQDASRARRHLRAILASLSNPRRSSRSRDYKAGSRKQEAGSRKQEAGSRKQEAGSRKQEAGSRKQGLLGDLIIFPDTKSDGNEATLQISCHELDADCVLDVVSLVQTDGGVAMRMVTALLSLCLCAWLWPVQAAGQPGFHLTKQPVVESSSPNQYELPLDFACPQDSFATWDARLLTSLGWSAHFVLDGLVTTTQLDGITCGNGEQLHLHVILGMLSDVTADSWVVLDVVFSDSSGKGENVQGQRLHLQRVGADLVPGSWEDFLASETHEHHGKIVIPFSGYVWEGPAEYQHVAPWDSPLLPAELREQLKKELDGQTSPDPAGGSGASLEGADTDEQTDMSEAPPVIPLGTSALPVALLGVVGLMFAITPFRSFVHLAGRRTIALSVLAVLLGATTLPLAAQATTGYVYGYLSYWDTRSGKSTDAGCRVCWCDTGDTTCLPYESDCCFEGIPRVKVELYAWRSGVGYYTADEDYTDYTGFYLLEDTDWVSGTYYRVDVHYERDGYPFTAIMTGETGSTPFESTTSWFVSSTQYNQRPNTSVNSVGDTTSTAGNLATYWNTAHDAAEAIEDEGDDRLRYLTGESGYDLITMRYYDVTGPSNSNCSTSTIHIDISDARTSTVAHELGHQYHARVVGCDGGAAVFPIFQWDPHHYKTAEGISLTESVAQITALITWWDPDTAETADIYDDFADCAFNSDAWDNTNRVSADRNNYLGIWEYIDTSTTQPWITEWDDNVDVTLAEMMDSLISWFEWTSSTCRNDGDCWTGEKCLEDIESTKRCHGRNRTSQERWMEDAETYCTPKDSEECDEGEVCSPGGVCYDGDPHGGNIRDWAYHLGVDLSISTTYITHVLWQTECVGYSDDEYPFEGGYHFE